MEQALGGGSNEYERIRNARIAQNEARLKALGIQQKKESLAGSVERSKSKKQKEKEKTNLSYEADEEYLPSHSEEQEEYNLLNVEIPRKVALSGSQHRVRYIPPRSMKNFSNIAKQLTFQKQDLSNDSHQRSQTERSVEEERARERLRIDDEQTRQRQDAEGVSLSQKQNGKKMTMADLILQKQSLLQATEVEGQQLGVISSPSFINSMRRNIHDQARPTEKGQDRHHLEAFENSPVLNKSPNSNTEEEDMPSDSEDELVPTEDDSSEQVNLDSRDLELDAILNEKTRGPTMLHHVHMRPFEKRKAIILNEFGQPIGPISEDEDTVAEFSRFLGTVARDYDYAPIVFDSWRKVPNKEKIWEYVLMKYNVPEEGKEWVLKTVGAAWRIYKCRFKKKHYYQYNDDKARWHNRSKRVPDEDFVKLLATWKKKSVKVRCSRNRDCRLAQKNMHTVGPKSFAIVREEMKNQNPNKEPPSLAELFERTRKRKEGKNYKESYEDTAQKIEAMKNYVPPTDESGPTDAFLGVMGKDYDGRSRLYGRGVCNKKLKKMGETTSTSYVVPTEVLESLKASLFEEIRKDMNSEITRVEQLQKDLEEDHEKKKAELENMQRDIENEREIMTEQIMRKILGKLPPDVARQYLS